MKHIFHIGDRKVWHKIVAETDAAAFDSGMVHPVYSTFAIGRDAEWCCRLFVLEMKDEDEEGIGTFLTIHHQSPALVGATVEFTAEIISLEHHEIICRWEARAGSRVLASGEQGQKILKKERLDRLFSSLSAQND